MCYITEEFYVFDLVKFRSAYKIRFNNSIKTFKKAV